MSGSGAELALPLLRLMLPDKSLDPGPPDTHLQGPLVLDGDVMATQQPHTDLHLPVLYFELITLIWILMSGLG